MCSENEVYLRNPNNYLQHEHAKSYGIQEYCIMNNLKYFHTTSNVCVDIMHDLLEGVCRYDMGYVLYEFIYNKKYFSLETLNRRIKYFDFHQGVDTGNQIPQLIKLQIKKKHLTMSAAEMLALVVYFPFLVTNFIDTEDTCWTFYLLLHI